MKTSVKKIVSVFLVAVIVFGFASVATAEDITDVYEETTTVFSEEETTSAPEEITTQPITEQTTAQETTTEVIDEETTAVETTTEEPATEEPTTEEPTTEIPEIQDPAPEQKEDDIVAVMYLCSRWSNIFTTGHIWIYIHNISSENLKVGAYELLPDEGVSVATFGMTRYDGKGVYYNMECYRDDKYCDDSCISMKQEITRSELETVSNKILVTNRWNIIYNCVHFACDVWNTVADKRVVPFFYPPVARLQIRAKGNGELCVMNNQPGEKSYKLRGYGQEAYLERVSQKSLDA